MSQPPLQLVQYFNCLTFFCIEECKIIIDDLEHEFDDNDTCTICGYIHNLGTPGLYYILTGDGSSYAVEKYFGIDLIVEIPENKFINLQAVKVVEFGHTPTPTESVEQLQRQVEALGKTWQNLEKHDF